MLSDPAELVADISQQDKDRYHNNDHIPFTLQLALDDRQAPPPPPPSRLRARWDIGRDPELWQHGLPAAMERHIAPLRPLLATLEPDAQLHHDIEPQGRLDSVYPAARGSDPRGVHGDGGRQAAGRARQRQSGGVVDA